MKTESTREVPSVVDSNPQASAKNLKKVTAQVVAAARVALEIQDDSITADTTFLAAFGSDSLGQINFLMEIDEFSGAFITDDELTQWRKKAGTMSMSDIASAILKRSS